ncbi:MAG: BrnA antitoxin family protein [Deltaproteobacteria bacterium]|nr:BrnA antitoxin family protein [Deltaproteobacteria bacterium]
MKQPKISDLKLEKKGTKTIREKIAKNQKIKITINLDSDLVALAKEISSKNGAPYQTYINFLLREALTEKTTQSQRLDRLERELETLKKKMSGTKRSKKQLQRA